MSLRSYLRLLRTSWECVAIFTLIGIIAAMAFSLSRSPTFVATSEIFLSTPRFGSITSNNNPYLADDFSQQRARSYVQLASRPDLARRVVEKLGIDMRPEELAAATSASVRPDTVLMDVSVRSSSPADAKVLADAMTAEFARDIRTLETPSGLKVPVVDPIVTQPAETPERPIEPNIPIYFLLGGSGGFLVGVTAASLLARRRVDGTQVENDGTQVEKLTGRPVLGTVVSDSADSEGLADGGPSTSNILKRQWDVVQQNVGVEIEHARDRVLAITTENGTRRSTSTAAGLASAFARAGSRVVMVLTQPNAHNYLTTREFPAVGLAEVVAGESPLDEAIQPADDKNLYYLAGPGPDKHALLLQSEKFRRVVDELRNSFDLVIFDMPEFLRQAESTLISEVVDAVILVLMERSTDKRDLSSSVRLISNSHVRLLGSIWESDSSGRSHSGPQHTFVTLSGRA